MALPMRKAFSNGFTQMMIRGAVWKPASATPVFCKRCLCTKSDSPSQIFNEKMLDFLVCPLSKQPLRYDKAANELISDTIGVAFPIVNGIPNLVPQDGRIINNNTDNTDNNNKEKS